MIHILVTGSSGQLGRSLQKLADLNSSFSFTFVSKTELDITDIKAVEAVFGAGQYDFCINCAAYTDVDQAEKTPEPAFEVNEKGAANLARVSKKWGVTLIHISTDYVFDGENIAGYSPADSPNPINVYGRSKWEGEKRIREILDRYMIIRTSWLYSEEGKNFYTRIRKMAEAGSEIAVTTKQIGCPTHADNLAGYILKTISEEPKNYGIHHFTDGEAMTWYEFAKKILIENDLLDLVNLVPGENHPSIVRRPACSVLVP